MSASQHHAPVNILELNRWKGWLSYWRKIHVQTQEAKQKFYLWMYEKVAGSRNRRPCPFPLTTLISETRPEWSDSWQTLAVMRWVKQETVQCGEMLTLGLTTGFPPGREWQQEIILQWRISFPGNQQGSQGSSSPTREQHSGEPGLDCSNFY